MGTTTTILSRAPSVGQNVSLQWLSVDFPRVAGVPQPMCSRCGPKLIAVAHRLWNPSVNALREPA